METLQNKIDFALIIQVENANPNGDPLNGNRPRTNYDGLGEISDVCLKRKIRDRMLERYSEMADSERDGQGVFVQSDDNNVDGCHSLRDRAESDEFGLGKKAFTGTAKKEESLRAACSKWLDVRTFGQLFAFKEDKKGDGVSFSVRGPLSIHTAFSTSPVSITSTQITKSVSGEGDGKKKASDTMGMKHRVDKGIYVTYGSINPQLASKTGFSLDDAQTIKKILPRLFENDASSARPEGSMRVKKCFWWQHNNKSGQYSSAVVHSSLKVNEDGSFEVAQLDGLKTEQIDGF